MDQRPSEFTIKSLGTPTLTSPIELATNRKYTNDTNRLLYNPHTQSVGADSKIPCFEIAGPRAKIYFEPRRTKAAIVTCGGLCPGLNAVIRALVMQLWHRYQVRDIVGIRYGYQGLGADASDEFVPLAPDKISDIHEQGGTILGSSRGSPPVEEMVRTLQKFKINMLFCIGGDGTMRGAQAIAEEAAKRNHVISIIGIPKTIDNDIPYVRRSFGFESAVAVACQAVISAHEEARGARNGIGLVKLMGRHSGYIAANTAIATGHANFCLIPEVPFQLEGPNGLLALTERRLADKGHAVIVVAEGAGQDFFKDQPVRKDASGNARLGDIGLYLKDKIAHHFENKKTPFGLRYIDPSYLIRSTPANPADRLFCARLAQNAVHAAMSGKTSLLIGYWHGEMTHVPFSVLAGHRQTINPDGELWFNVLEATGQPMKI